MNASFHRLALEEMTEAGRYYNQRSSGLGARFLDSVQETVTRTKQFPKVSPPFLAGSRRSRVPGFPYGVVYRIQGEELRILAVMHLQRKDDYWIERK